MQIHELNNFAGTLGSGAYLAIDNGTDTGKISSQGLLAATEARIDNIIAGPAPSAQEVTDARLGADGVTYPSLGDAIRDQFTDLKSDINHIEDACYTSKSLNFNSTTYGVIDPTTGGNLPSSSSKRTEVDISGAYKVSFYAHAYSSNYGYAFMDAGGNYISGKQTTTTGTMTIPVPLNAKTFKVCWNQSETQNIVAYYSTPKINKYDIGLLASLEESQTDFFYENQYNKSEYNLIRCVSFEMENPSSGITLTYNGDYVSIVGSITSNQKMLVRVDIDELEAGTYYLITPYDLKGNNNYGVYFMDKDKQRLTSTVYINNQNFATLTLSATVSGIEYICILLASTGYSYNHSGYVFLNKSTKYISAGQDGYTPKYTPKNIQSVLNGKKWVAIGDSTTTGSTSQSDVPGLTYNWEKLVCDKTGMTCVNLGIPGSTTSGFYAALESIPSDADIITIMGGINDMAQSVRTYDVEGYEYNSGTYPGSIRRLVKYIVQNFPDATLILCSCIGGFSKTDTGNFDLPVKNNENNTIEDYANTCKAVAHELSMPFMDVFGECGISTLNRTSYISDAVHPNVAGYKKLANVFLNYFVSHQKYIV